MLFLSWWYAIYHHQSMGGLSFDFTKMKLIMQNHLCVLRTRQFSSVYTIFWLLWLLKDVAGKISSILTPEWFHGYWLMILWDNACPTTSYMILQLIWIQSNYTIILIHQCWNYVLCDVDVFGWLYHYTIYSIYIYMYTYIYIDSIYTYIYIYIYMYTI